jgi:hypothetical protein
MVNGSSIPPEAILNPYTPLAFLPPEFADKYEIVCYVHVATFVVSLLIQCDVKKSFSACSLIGLHMGLAHGNAGGVRDCPQYGNYRTQYRLFFVEVSVIRWKHWPSSAHLAYEYG